MYKATLLTARTVLWRKLRQCSFRAPRGMSVPLDRYTGKHIPELFIVVSVQEEKWKKMRTDSKSAARIRSPPSECCVTKQRLCSASFEIQTVEFRAPLLDTSSSKKAPSGPNRSNALCSCMLQTSGFIHGHTHTHTHNAKVTTLSLYDTENAFKETQGYGK